MFDRCTPHSFAKSMSDMCPSWLTAWTRVIATVDRSSDTTSTIWDAIRSCSSGLSSNSSVIHRSILLIARWASLKFIAAPERDHI